MSEETTIDNDSLFSKEEQALLEKIYSKSKTRELTAAETRNLKYLVDTVADNDLLEEEISDDEIENSQSKLGRPFTGSIISIIRDTGETETVKIGWRELNRSLTEFSELELLQILHYELLNTNNKDLNRAYRVYQRYSKVRQIRERKEVLLGQFDTAELLAKYNLPEPTEVSE